MTRAVASPNAELELTGRTLLSERRHIDGRFHHRLDRWDGDVFLWLIRSHEGRIVPDRCDGQLAEDVTGALVAGSETERSDGDEDGAHSLSLGRLGKWHPMGRVFPFSVVPTVVGAIAPADIIAPDDNYLGRMAINSIVIILAPFGIIARSIRMAASGKYWRSIKRRAVDSLPFRDHVRTFLCTCRDEIERLRALSSRLHYAKKRGVSSMPEALVYAFAIEGAVIDAALLFFIGWWWLATEPTS